MNPELQALIESGPLAYLSTINKDGSPQVSAIWIGLDEQQQIVSGHMQRSQKTRISSAIHGRCAPTARPAPQASFSPSMPSSAHE